MSFEDNFPPPSPALVNEYLDRFEGAWKRLFRAREEQRAANERVSSAEKLIADLQTGASAFGFDLIEEMKRRIADQIGPPEEQSPLTMLDDRPSVREFILAEAEAAAPNAVRASSLRLEYERRFGVSVHEKTFGMTLYRIAQKTGAVKRVARADWVFVEEGHRRPFPDADPPSEDNDEHADA